MKFFPFLFDFLTELLPLPKTLMDACIWLWLSVTTTPHTGLPYKVW